MRHIRRKLIFIAAAILTVLAGGTAGFVLIEGWPAFDAFYMALMTITTVGYMEVHPLSQAGRLFNSFLIFFGVSTMFLAVGAMTQTIIELELNRYFEHRGRRRMIDRLDGHYIVCGYGRVGRGAAAELRRSREPFVVLDRNEERVERAWREGVLAMQGDASLDETLTAVGLLRAKGLIASLSSDADNLFLIVSARALNPAIQIATRVMEVTAEEKLRRAGANSVFTPYSSAGIRLVQSILRPHVTHFLDSATADLGLHVSIEQVRVADGCALVSHSLGSASLRRDLGVIVLAIRKAGGEMIFNPAASTVIAAGDYLIAMGDSEQLHRLEESLTKVVS